MTPDDQNKALYRRWFEEVVSLGDERLADELLDPSYRLHFPGVPQPLDREAHKGMVRTLQPTAQVTATGVGIARFQNGRIVEAGAAYDALGLLQQLGASPATPTGAVQ
jgi:hypothetical protein